MLLFQALIQLKEEAPNRSDVFITPMSARKFVLPRIFLIKEIFVVSLSLWERLKIPFHQKSTTRRSLWMIH